MEDYLGAIEDVCNEKLVDAIIVDTLSAMCPRAVFQKGTGTARELGDDTVGAAAKRIGQFVARCQVPFARSRACVVLVCQVRTGGIGGPVTFEELPGGKALRHHAIRILQTRRTGKSDPSIEKVTIKTDGHKYTLPTGFVMNILLERDGFASNEGQRAYVPFLYGVGPDDLAVCVMEAKRLGILQEPSKAWFIWPDKNGEEVKVHGAPALEQYFKDNEDEAQLLRNRVAEVTLANNPDEHVEVKDGEVL